MSPTIRRVGSKKPKSRELFFNELSNNFDERVLNGLEIRKRESIKMKKSANQVLNDSENQALIHSMNAASEEFVGLSTPDPATCILLANILRSEFPETFARKEIVNTEYGPIPLKRNGKGWSNLEKRLASNYYNRIVRQNAHRVVGADRTMKVKKVRKIYGMSKDRWNMASNASKADLEVAEMKISELERCEELEKKKELITEGATFLQKMFSTEEPSHIVDNLPGFFSGGPLLLQHWMSIMSEDSSDLVSKTEEQMKKVCSLIENFLLEKKEDTFELILNARKAQSLAKYGNETDYILYLLTELAKWFKDKPSKIFVEDGKDEEPSPEKQTPNILITVRRNPDRQSDYEMDFWLKVCIGDKVLFTNLQLPEALASLISLFFVMNLSYPSGKGY